MMIVSPIANTTTPTGQLMLPIVSFTVGEASEEFTRAEKQRDQERFEEEKKMREAYLAKKKQVKEEQKRWAGLRKQ